MLIFTPAVQFAHEIVLRVQVLPGLHSIVGGSYEARLSVLTPQDIFIFYGEEAFSVLCQLEEAGFYTTAQRLAVAARLGDEMTLADAGRTSIDDV